MRTDHIRNFNLACASVAKLAAEAIEEHRRQIEEIEALGREALELADKLTADAQSLERQHAAAQLKLHTATTLMPRTIGAAAAPASVPVVPEISQAVEQELYINGAPSMAAPSAAESGDILTLAMRRVEHEETAEPKSEEPDEPLRDLAVLAVGREIVASLSGKRRQRRSNAR
jgi:hypothetical protein